MSPDDIKKGFADLAEQVKGTAPQSEEVTKLFKLLERVTGTPFKESSNADEEEDCPDGEDCSDLLSECCNAALSTVFGTIPLEVKCAECEKTYVLRELLVTQKT